MPSYNEAYEFKHMCSFDYEQNGDADSQLGNDDHLELGAGVRKCSSIPFVSSNNSRATEVAKKLAVIVKEVISWLFPLEITNEMKIENFFCFPYEIDESS